MQPIILSLIIILYYFVEICFHFDMKEYVVVNVFKKKSN